MVFKMNVLHPIFVQLILRLKINKMNFDHTTFQVTDIDAAIKWYIEKLNFAFLFQNDSVLSHAVVFRYF